MSQILKFVNCPNLRTQGAIAVPAVHFVTQALTSVRLQLSINGQYMKLQEFSKKCRQEFLENA